MYDLILVAFTVQVVAEHNPDGFKLDFYADLAEFDCCCCVGKWYLLGRRILCLPYKYIYQYIFKKYKMVINIKSIQENTRVVSCYRPNKT